jgi:hypothetical protein
LSDIKHRKIPVTPQLAKKWLATNNENRKISPTWVSKLARDMRNGQFPNIGETIKFDTEGHLIDGQHRLSALIDAGVTLEFIIVENIAREDRFKMDKNRRRSASDELTMGHGIPSAKSAQAVTRLVLLWEVEEVRGEVYKPTDAEIVDYVIQNRDAMGQAVRYGMGLRNEIGALPAAFGCLYFLTFRIDAATALEFWEGVRNGEGLHAGDPELALRALIIRSAQKGGEKPVKPFLAAGAKAWNAKREGKKIKVLALKGLTELTDDHFKLA